MRMWLGRDHAVKGGYVSSGVDDRAGGRLRRNSRLAAAAVLAACVSAGVAVAPAPAYAATGADASQDASGSIAVAARPSRPRIGLVLGGGGAKGAAHVGVLSVLDELRIPVDCIVGTSMGALVGGTYASGMSAAELDTAVRAISWQEAIGSTGLRAQVPMRRKLTRGTYSLGLEFGVRDGGLAAPSGLVNTQNIDLTIQYLVARSRGVAEFDRLPIPFRAVATDMQTGDMVVLDRGDLALAMRASMAVPGVFSPVSMDGRVLGDGGLTRNVPVDIARQTCADVVIAVAVPNPAPTAEELRSPLTLMSRTLDVLIGANERQQLETLGSDDVKILVEMGDIGSGSFDRVADAIPLGRSAALARRAELERYSVPEAEYLAWRDAASRPGRNPVTLAGVNLNGLVRANPDFVRRTLDLEAGDVVDARGIGDRAMAVFALSDFERVAYTLGGDPESATLEMHLTEKSWGPHIVRFDLGVQMDTDGTTAFTLGADYLQTWINDRGGELHGVLRIGRTSVLEGAVYQPLDRAQRWFVEPGISAQRSLEDVFVDGEPVTRTEFASAWGYADVGRVFGNRAELRTGIRYGVQSADRDFGAGTAFDVDPEGYGGFAARFTFDSRDRDVLWRAGTVARVQYFRSSDTLGMQAAPYERLEGTATVLLPFLRNVGYLRVGGGSSLDTRLPLYDTFTLGGPVSLPGLSLGELRGDSYWNVQAAYMQRLADLNYVFGRSLYTGVTLTAADMNGRIDGIRGAPIYSGAWVLAGRTALGPLTLSVGATTDGDWQIVFGLGRPIEERTITDPW
jgi:NTE family protein